MGNVLRRGGINRRCLIKIMKADGTVMKLRSSVSVKQILIDYPNHGIFEAPLVLHLGSAVLLNLFLRGQNLSLLISIISFLSPLHSDQLIIYNDNSNRGTFARVPSASCRLEPSSYAGTARDSIKEEKEVDPVVNRGGLRVVSSYSTGGSSVRVKLRLRKEELASFLSDNNLLMENVVVPTIFQRPPRQSALSPWKPSLDTIAELHNPFSDS